jgi:hypothetical protein
LRPLPAGTLYFGFGPVGDATAGPSGAFGSRMKLEFIATLANERVRLRFVAMERSLRAKGCLLPIRVIPFDDQTFELPPGSEWWRDAKFFRWLETNGGNAYMRRYLCLAEKNYQFIDTDACFLRNPAEALASESGFVVCCSHWQNPEHTVTEASLLHFRRRSTTWQRLIFNSGQFACDRAVFTLDELRRTVQRPEIRETFRFNDQPGLNLLLLESGVALTNLTLPPHCLESSWAGDYPEYPHRYWESREKMPYLIHWAGLPIHRSRAIDAIFLDYYTPAERREWLQLLRQSELRARRMNGPFRRTAKKLRSALEIFTKGNDS